MCRNGFLLGDTLMTRFVADQTSLAAAEATGAQLSLSSPGPSIFHQIVTSAFGEKHTSLRYYPLQMKLSFL